MSVPRLGLVLVTMVVLQVALFTHLRLFGVVPDLGLLVAVAVAYKWGPEAGALTGFVAGFLYDLFLETPLGLSALAYALTGYGVGLLQAGMLREPRGLTALIGGLAGLACNLMFAALGILAGYDALRESRTIEVVLVAALYDALLAPAVFWLVNRFVDRERGAPSAFRTHS